MAEDGRARLMDAVEEMCASTAPANLTMRAVAEEAGVSVGLTYHHFESKDDLIGSTLDRMASRITARATSADDPAEGLLRLWSLLAEFPAFPRIVTALVLEDRDVTALMSGHPLIRDMAALASARGHRDPETAAALVALLGVAGAFYGPTMNRAADRDPSDARLYDAAAEMLQDWLVSAEVATDTT